MWSQFDHLISRLNLAVKDVLLLYWALSRSPPELPEAASASTKDVLSSETKGLSLRRFPPTLFRLAHNIPCIASQTLRFILLNRTHCSKRVRCLNLAVSIHWSDFSHYVSFFPSFTLFVSFSIPFFVSFSIPLFVSFFLCILCTKYCSSGW